MRVGGRRGGAGEEDGGGRGVNLLTSGIQRGRLGGVQVWVWGMIS